MKEKEKFFSMLRGEMTDEKRQAIEEAKQEYQKKMQRKEESLLKCCIPDTIYREGMIEFWINPDGTFESEGVYDNDKIKEAIRRFANEWAH